MKTIVENRHKWFYGLLILGILLVNIKRVFVDFNIDAEYAVAMSYRLANGDKMFLQMWEPHQTSAFFGAILIKLWMLLTGTTTGLVLYLNIMGLFFRGGVALFLFFTLKRYCSPRALFIMIFLLMTLSEKGLIMPEYANMQVCFSILMFCSLVRFLQDQCKIVWLILSALFLCLTVLSYPSCLILCFIVLGQLFALSKRRLSNILLFMAVCFAAGVTYLLHFITSMGIDKFILCVKEIITGDSTHSVSFFDKLAGYGKDLVSLLILYITCAFVGAVLVQLIWLLYRQKCFNSRKIAPTRWYIYGFFFGLFLCSLKNVLTSNYRFGFAEMFVPSMCVALCMLKNCDAKQRQIVIIGISISIGELLATLCLTNLSFFTSLPYMTLGLMVSVIPIEHTVYHSKVNVRAESVIGILFCMLIVFKNLFIIYPMTLYYANIFEIRNVVKNGPAIGIFSNYMGPHIMNTNMSEWKRLVKEGDNILLIGGGGTASSLGYLYEDVNICVDSTISTTTYNEKLLRYWELNPDKMPDVVIVDCWFGELNVDVDSWIMQWVEKEFSGDNYVDGTYIRCYRR